jgi:two-component system NtrC family sensor kinase
VIDGTKNAKTQIVHLARCWSHFQQNELLRGSTPRKDLMKPEFPGKTGGDHQELRILTEKLDSIQIQMLHCEKMAAVGQLAAGVAHEINNPTGFVASNLNTLLHYQKVFKALILQYQRLLGELKEGLRTSADCAPHSKRISRIDRIQARFKVNFFCDDALATIRESIEGTARIKRIVSDLKRFTHPGENHLEQADLHMLLESTLNLVWNEIKYKAQVEKDFGHLPQVRCYASQLNQVFLNLLVNASHAIEDRGIIRIKTRLVDQSVIIAISDTGCGISEDNLSKIFEPFFTTKEVGRGTGLGLHLCRNIVHRHNGRISVESQLGQGSTFSIMLPVDPLSNDGPPPSIGSLS